MLTGRPASSAVRWHNEVEDAQIFGYTLEETRAFAMKALERRLKVIGLATAS